MDYLTKALERFRRFCRFDATTGCVLWVGGTTKGRGHHVDYPAFWFLGERWFGHRFSARYIHGLDIDSYQVDHCCPHRPYPETLCVEHVQAITPKENRDLQALRKRMIHMQVGLVDYHDVYGHRPAETIITGDNIPFFQPPAWLSATIQGEPHGSPDCPF